MTMIKNQKQLAFSKEQIEKFEKTLIETEKTKEDKNPILFKLEKDALNSLLNDLKKEVKEYEDVKTKETIFFENMTLDDLSKMIIYSRIAEGITQTELADRLGLSQQQINRYESTDYESASLSRVLEIMDSLSINLKINFTISKENLKENSYELPEDIPSAKIINFENKVKQRKTLMSF